MKIGMAPSEDTTADETRVLVLPQTSADGAAMGRLFHANAIPHILSSSSAALCEAVKAGVGAVIISEEALVAASADLMTCLIEQPVWSDLPVIVLSRSGLESPALERVVQNLGNVSVVERPIRTSTLVSLVRSSLRARARQYQLRAYLLEQEQSQRAIREGDRRYRALIENVSDYAIFMTDLDGRVSTWNPGAERVLGYTESEVLGRSVALFLPEGADPAVFANEVRQACATGKAVNTGWRVSRDGTALYVESALLAMRDEGGDLLGYAYFLRDVTERQRIETEREQLLESERAARTEAERASRMKEEFLATLSHELRTPLNSILGWTQLACRNHDLTEDVRNALTVIDRNARSQARIIADLLDMSSIVSGKVRLDMQRLQPAEIIEATLTTVKPAAEAKGIRLEVRVDPMVSPIRGDPNRLQQVLWNLLTNAVKFTPQGGCITVRLAQVQSHVEIEVADSGEGIDSEFLPQVFDRFRQADASTSRRHGGLGLGLSIVKQLVELHGGTISASSPGLGKGAVFRIALPEMTSHLDAPVAQRMHPAAGSDESRSEESGPVNLNGLHVLVVDDEPDSRTLLHRLLMDCEARVSTARSAEEAIQMLMRDPPDVMISDLGMPGEDGYSMMRRIRQLDQACAGVPAIALTAYARVEDRVRAIRAGYQLHLAKPVEPVELLTLLRSLAQRVVERR